MVQKEGSFEQTAESRRLWTGRNIFFKLSIDGNSCTRFTVRESVLCSDKYSVGLGLGKFALIYICNVRLAKMMRRSFQLSGSYDVIKDATDLESKCAFIFSQNLKVQYFKISSLCLIFTLKVNQSKLNHFQFSRLLSAMWYFNTHGFYLLREQENW